jgi:hypothetical protein
MRIGVALTLALSGCAMMGEYHYRTRLAKAVEASGETLRWGGGSGLESLRDGQRVTNVEVRGMRFNEDKDKATVRVEVEGYEMPRMVLRRWIYDQEWEDKSDGWVLVRQKEVKPKAAAAPSR